MIPPEARREIEAVLGTFRQWLLEAETWRDAVGGAATEPEETGVPVDLHTILREWIALKQELHLEARGSKTTREALTDAMETFHQSAGQARDEARSLLDPLVRERDRLRDALGEQREVEAQRWLELLFDVREALARGAGASRRAGGRLGWRRRLLPRGLLEGLFEGYELALRRIDAALESRDVRRIECEGQRVDPERMRVVALVQRDDVPPGHVADVVRCGYVRGHRVMRYAEVRAVEATAANGTARQVQDDDSETQTEQE